MNEYIEVQFFRKGKRLKVRRQLPNLSIELDEPDPVERRVTIGIVPADEITAYRVRRIRQLRSWAPGEFRLKVTAEGGTLVLKGDDPEALPEGRYQLRIGVEEAKSKPRRLTAAFDQDGFCEFPVDLETDDRQVQVDLSESDALVRRLLDASVLDGLDGATWLADPTPRPARKACLLNLLASLRVRPLLSAPLLGRVESFYHVTNDRAYARASFELLGELDALAQHPKKPFYREGSPKAPVHLKLITSIPAPERSRFAPERLVSFRGEGSPSLQTVVAEGTPGHHSVFAEFDLDLGNALQDVVGFVVHLGELLDGKPTNHLDLRKKLAAKNARTRDYLYYTVLA
jgi:hypothetical protein